MDAHCFSGTCDLTDFRANDPDCTGELQCDNGIDDDDDDLFETFKCWDGSTLPTETDLKCFSDADCAGEATKTLCNTAVLDNDCECMDADLGTSPGCTAGDVSLTFVSTPNTIVIDGCSSTDPTDTITLTGISARYGTTGGNRRYDLASWVDRDGTGARTGRCNQIMPTSPVGTCALGLNPCETTADCVGGADFCDPSYQAVPDGTSPFIDPKVVPPTPGDRNPGGGLGPYRNMDGDACGDGLGSDDVLADGTDLIYDIPYQMTFACADADNDGRLEVDQCTAYVQSNSGLDCGGLSTNNAPGTGSKCTCVESQSAIPVPSLVFSCECNPVVKMGDPTTCTVNYNNPAALGDGTSEGPACDDSDTASMRCSDDPQGPICIDDGDCNAPATCILLPYSLRCNNSAFIAFDVDYDETQGGVSNINPSNGTAPDGGSSILWTPENSENIPEVIGNGESGNLEFQYTPTIAMGTIPLNVTILWSGAGTAGGTAPNVAQGDGVTCNIEVDPDFAVIESFRAYELRGNVIVEWRTALEIDTKGFDLYRRRPGERYRQVNQRLLPAAHQLPGGVYRFVDPTASVGAEYEYMLTESDGSEKGRSHGPFRVRVETTAPAVRTSSRGSGVGSDLFDVEARKATPRELERLRLSREEQAGRSEDLNGPFARRRRAAKQLAGVTESGMYRLSEFDRGWRRRTDWSVLSGDTEVSAANLRGVGLVFFGDELDSSYTSENVYRIEPGEGRPIHVVPGNRPGPVAGQSFLERAHFEQEIHMRTRFAKDAEDDYWYWLLLVPGHAEYGEQTADLDVRGATGDGNANLRMKIFGDPGPKEVEVWLNGFQIGQLDWDAAASWQLEAEFDSGLLNEGSNELRLVGVTGIFLVDSVEVTYMRANRAHEERLLLPGRDSAMSIDGFSSPEIFVFDVTHPVSPRMLDDTVIDAGGVGSRVSFSGQAGRRYAVVSIDGFREVSSLRGQGSADLRSSSNGADYLVIAPESLAAEAQALADFRSESGLLTMVVHLEDIMAAFNGGVAHPKAIRDFLAYAYTQWSVPPRFAVLAGAGHIDFKDHLGFGGNLIPPLLILSGSDLVASDSVLGDVDRDGVPEVSMGRIPIVLGSELLGFISRLDAYENGLQADWTGNALMVADRADSAGNFPVDSDAMIAGFPGGITANRIYLDLPFSLGQSRTEFVNQVNAGTGYVNLTGHGGLSQFGKTGMVRSTEVQQLANGSQLPIVTSLTCYIGYFGFPGFVALGEELLLHDSGGAAAVWGPAGFSYNDTSVEMGIENFDAFFGGEEMVGDALRLAAEAYVGSGGDPERLKVYNLLGDPATQLP